MLVGIVFGSENIPGNSASERAVALSCALLRDLNAADLSSIFEAARKEGEGYRIWQAGPLAD